MSSTEPSSTTNTPSSSETPTSTTSIESFVDAVPLEQLGTLNNTLTLPALDSPSDLSPSPPSDLTSGPKFINENENAAKEVQKEKEEKKGGRRKINIEFIDNKSRRHVTFSKRKGGLIKKAYELSTLTGTQVLLLVASETGNVYTFATPKLQPIITKPEGKALIQSCLNPPEEIPPSTPNTTQSRITSTVEPPTSIYSNEKSKEKVPMTLPELNNYSAAYYGSTPTSIYYPTQSTVAPYTRSYYQNGFSTQYPAAQGTASQSYSFAFPSSTQSSPSSTYSSAESLPSSQKEHPSQLPPSYM